MNYSKLRVFCGYVNTGGIAFKIADGLRKNGIKADSVVVGDHHFSYPYHKDVYFPDSKHSIIIKFFKYYYFIIFLFKYNVFIFNTRSTLLSRKWDLKIFRFFGKKTAMIYTGCDIRDRDFYLTLPRKYTACKNCTEAYQKRVQCIMPQKLSEAAYIQENIDISFSHPFDAMILNGNYRYLYLLLELDQYKPNFSLNERIKILHVPSDEGFKGTNYVLSAIEKLKNDPECSDKFEFELLKNKTHDETIEAIRNCDILIDQMVAGWYGLISVEAMALGKTAVCYIDEKLYDYLPDLPIANMNPDNLAERLKSLINKKDSLPDIGRLGRAFVEKYHDHIRNSKTMLDMILNSGKK